MSKLKEADLDKVEKHLRNIVLGDEQIIKAFKLVRDFVVFTDRRVLSVDKQGVTGSRREFLSIPYKSIDYWGVECGKNFELSHTLRLFVRGMKDPLTRDFKSEDALYEVQRILVTYCK